MQKITFSFSLTLLFFVIACSTKMEDKTTIHYPDTRKDSIVDDYHGTQVRDPYRWLEDDYSEETQKWVIEQNRLTQSVLEQIPFRPAIQQRLTDLWNYERFGAPFKKGGKYYYFKNDGLQNQSVLYKEVKDGEDVVVLDPNTLSEDGTTSLGSISFSKDGHYMGYQISEGGSDWRTVKVMDMEAGEILEDALHWIKFSEVSWYGDGFFYSRYPAPKEEDELSGQNKHHSLYYHRLGQSQEEDVLVYRDEEHPQRNLYASVDEDEKYLVLNIVESTSGNAVKLAKLKKEVSQLDFVAVVDSFESDYNYITTIADRLIFTTNDGASHQKVMAVDPQHPEREDWQTVIQETENTLRWLVRSKDYLVAGYLKNASSQVKVFDLDFNEKYDLSLPGIGTVGGFRTNEKDNIAYYAFTSFTFPTTIMKVDLSKGESETFKSPQLDIDLSAYETIQKWYESKDGTRVPMFITQKKGAQGPAPTLLYGYGGFDIAVEPSFRVSTLILLENGGRYVVANIRGGGEFGKEWHKAGTLNQKQNVFDDFIAAGQYLIDQGYTSNDLLAIEGGSNGGLLVGACMTQRPDLFKVAFPRVGVLDMLRYHEFTIGWAWATDYGRSDDPNAFQYLYAYSPVHNIKDAQYPATLIMTADHDDRVVPAHSFKFAAALQAHQKGNNPVLIRIETSAGHGAGKPTSKSIEEETDKWSFMFGNMNQNISY